jgi:EAL domain-containing protein (putative c-di-GMP-specific phosphodiesterase class I)
LVPDLGHFSPRRLSLVAELHAAPARRELVVDYQPIVDVATGRTIAVEALVRWIHPKLGRLGPNQFIPLAEETGAIGKVTAAVIEEALRQQRAWRRSGHDVRVTVNVSATSLADSAFPGLIARMLDDAGVEADRLILEITESSLMVEPARAVATLTRLTQLGVGLAIDDFGTGYSSLAYLQQLPVDAVKIDKSFVTGLIDSDVNAAIVRSITDLGMNLGLAVIAEGVEDRDTLDLLESLGCRHVQGFHTGRPMAADDVPAHLASTPLSAVAGSKVFDLTGRSPKLALSGDERRHRRRLTNVAAPVAARR